MNFKNWKIKSKLITSIVIAVVMFLAMGITAIIGTRSINSDATDIVDNSIPSLDAAHKINTTKSDYVIQVYKHIISDDKNDQAELEQIMSEKDKEIQDLIEKYVTGLVTNDEDKRIINEIKEKWDNYMTAIDEVITLSHDMKTQDAMKLMKENKPIFDATNKLAIELVEFNQKSVDEDEKGLIAIYNFVKVFAIIFLIAGISLLIALNMYILVSIAKPLNNSSNKLGEAARTIAEASGQLSSSSQQFAGGASEQASSIEEVSSTMEESSSMIRQSAENMRQAAGLATQANEAANIGSNEMKEMMSSMTEIKKSGSELASIIKVIDEIAFQTNILALNAAVEAARAGDAGKGFAVVAEEVRNLAQRSANAAKDTNPIIQKNIDLSNRGEEASIRVDQALNEISSKIQKLNNLTAEVSAATAEQVQGTEQINKALARMSTVTQQNAAGAEESASAAEELNGQAGSLEDIVAQLMAMVHGNSDKGANYYKTSNKNFSTGKGTREYDRNSKHFSETIKPKKAASVTHTQSVKQPKDVIPLEDDNEF